MLGTISCHRQPFQWHPRLLARRLPGAQDLRVAHDRVHHHLCAADPARLYDLAKARRDRRRLEAISPPPTHFVPGKALPKPIPTGPRAHDTRGRSPARVHSPPRKRARVESPRADPVTVRCSVELRELEERVRQLERENDEAHKQERALRDELNTVRQRSGSMGTLVEMDTWKRRAVEAEERVRSQWDRLRAGIANDGTDALTDSGDDESK